MTPPTAGFPAGRRLAFLLAIALLASCVSQDTGPPERPSTLPPTSPATTATLTTPTTTVSPPTTAQPIPGTASAPADLEFTVSSFGSGAVAQLPGSGTMLGSGCTPGADDQSDGIWFGWIAQIQLEILDGHPILHVHAGMIAG